MSNTQDILDQLIAFPTVSRDSNLELINFVQEYLDARGIKSELFYNRERSKANLFATIGTYKQGGVILSGHTDVVPVDGQAWTVEPFRVTENKGRLYGRGTADMKGFIASVLAAVPAFQSVDLKLPVHLAFSYDEEVGCLGVRHMLAEIAKRPLMPILCLVGEPTGMKPVLAHKGKLAMRCRVRGHPCHSAYSHEGVNAIEYAAKVITRLNTIRDELMRPQYCDDRFDPPFSTVQTGLIKGGEALNIVPEECVFDFEVRALPGFNPELITDRLKSYVRDELLPTMRAVSADTDIQLERISAYPGLSTSIDSEAAKLLAHLTGSSEFGAVAFGTEGGLFDQVGIPAMVCGPGNIAQAHKPDEFVTLDQLHECDAMLRRLLAYLQSPHLL